MPEVAVDGVRLYYEEKGTGIPCIVPGGADHRRAYSPQLQQHLRMLFVELRESGHPSGGRVEDITLDRYVDDLDQFRRALGLDRVVMMGHSVPGTFVLDYARRYPAHISHAVVTGVPLQFTDAARATNRRYFEEHADAERKAEAARAFAEIPPEELANPSSSDWWHRRYLANRALFWRDPTFDAAYLFEGSHINIEAFRHTMRLMQGRDLTPTLPAIVCPVFVAQGRYDFSVPPPVWEEAWSLLPRGAYRVFEESGHWPMIEERKAFDAALTDWLSATRA